MIEHWTVHFAWMRNRAWLLFAFSLHNQTLGHVGRSKNSEGAKLDLFQLDFKRIQALLTRDPSGVHGADSPRWHALQRQHSHPSTTCPVHHMVERNGHIHGRRRIEPTWAQELAGINGNCGLTSKSSLYTNSFGFTPHSMKVEEKLSIQLVEWKARAHPDHNKLSRIRRLDNPFTKLSVGFEQCICLAHPQRRMIW